MSNRFFVDLELVISKSNETKKEKKRKMLKYGQVKVYIQCVISTIHYFINIVPFRVVKPILESLCSYLFGLMFTTLNGIVFIVIYNVIPSDN